MRLKEGGGGIQVNIGKFKSTEIKFQNLDYFASCFPIFEIKKDLRISLDNWSAN